MSLSDYGVTFDTIQRAVGFLLRFNDNGEERFLSDVMPADEAKKIGEQLISAADVIQRKIDKDGVTFELAQKGLAEWALREEKERKDAPQPK